MTATNPMIKNCPFCGSKKVVEVESVWKCLKCEKEFRITLNDNSLFGDIILTPPLMCGKRTGIFVKLCRMIWKK